jgi:hypothetical protein
MPEETSETAQPFNGTNHCFKTWSSNCKDKVSAARPGNIFEEPDPRDRARSNRFGTATATQENHPLFGQPAPRCLSANQEQPFRHALSPATGTFNSVDDTTGPTWAVVYVIASNASSYCNHRQLQSANSKMQRNPSEDLRLSSEGRAFASASAQGQRDTPRDNPLQLESLGTRNSKT